MTRVAGLCVFALLVFGPIAYAQHYGFQAFGRDAGLHSLEIQCLYQDRTGFLWVGTKNGLYRYDGSRFIYFDKEKGLPGLSIQSVHQTTDGTLWVAALEGLARFNGNGFETVKLGGKYTLYGQNIL